MKKCPFCGEAIQDDAKKCRYCLEWIEEKKEDTIKDEKISSQLASNSTIEPESVKCPNCGLINPKSAMRCDCGYDFTKGIGQQEQLKLDSAHPWLRYWARMLDVFIFSIVFGIIMSFIEPRFLDLSVIISGIIILFIWTFVESFLLAGWGTTLGKYLLSIKVIYPGGAKLSYSAAYNRSISVWINGIGAGIPIISLITLISSHSKLKNEGITSWDKKGGFRTEHEKIKPLRVLIMIMLYAIILYQYFYSINASQQIY